MSELKNKSINKTQRAARTRSTIHGTAERPRLSVVVTNRHVSAQLINDDEGKTIAAATSLSAKDTQTMTEKAKDVGVEIAKRAKKAKVTKVAFDRGAKKYHGRIKVLADAARENGLEF